MPKSCSPTAALPSGVTKSKCALPSRTSKSAALTSHVDFSPKRIRLTPDGTIIFGVNSSYVPRIAVAPAASEVINSDLAVAINSRLPNSPRCAVPTVSTTPT